MRIYRIETENGKGICLSGNLCREYHKAGSELAHKICPCNHLPLSGVEVIILEMQGMKYAFQSKEAMKEWFPAEDGRERMRELGGKLIEYIVDDGETILDTVGMQLMFHPEHAIRNAEFDLVSLEERK